MFTPSYFQKGVHLLSDPVSKPPLYHQTNTTQQHNNMTGNNKQQHNNMTGNNKQQHNDNMTGNNKQQHNNMTGNNKQQHNDNILVTTNNNTIT